MQTTRKSTATATILTVSLLTIFLVGASPIPKLLAAVPASGAALDAVQISIQTANLTSVSSYDLVAYNSTGTPVASYTGQYPSVTFDLPSGTYLFAATAYGPASARPPVCCACAQPEGASTSSANAGSAAPVAPNILVPCFYGNQPEEYGYSLSQVTGAASITIDTQSPSGVPTTDLSVSVSFENGTAVSGADVSANVVGGDLNWGANSSISMYAQTGENGVAQLVVPALPLELTASDSVQVNLTQSQKVVQVNVGGQPVNVTVYYSPSYVYLSASALVIPPQSSLSLVLTAQPQPIIAPYAQGSAASGSLVASSGSEKAPTQSTSITSADTLTSIPPIPARDVGSPAPAPASSGASGISALELGTLAMAGALAAVVGIAISKRR